MAYREVFQTWSFVRVAAAPPLAVANDTPVERASEEWRHTVQKARIDRRWSVADLAARIQCDTETLAAFERGTHLLDEGVQRRLRAELRLVDSGRTAAAAGGDAASK